MRRVSAANIAVQISERPFRHLFEAPEQSTIPTTMAIRTLAIVPILFSIASLVLAFLCLFAGPKENFMEDYSVLTVSLLIYFETTLKGSTHVYKLNTSRIGQQLFNTNKSSDNPFLKYVPM